MKHTMPGVLLLLVFLAACSGATGSDAEPAVVRLMTHDSFDISAELIADFESETGIRVEVFKGGDGGELVNKAILTRDAPLADVVFGIDNTFLSRALENDLFLAYESPRLADVSDALKLDPEFRVSPVDYGDICLNYDVAWFAESAIPAPDDLADLADPTYAGLTVPLIASALLVAFALAKAIQGTRFAPLTPYVDPTVLTLWYVDEQNVDLTICRIREK